jgi:hypothetical protein
VSFELIQHSLGFAQLGGPVTFGAALTAAYAAGLLHLTWPGY